MTPTCLQVLWFYFWVALPRIDGHSLLNEFAIHACLIPAGHVQVYFLILRVIVSYCEEDHQLQLVLLKLHSNALERVIITNLNLIYHLTKMLLPIQGLKVVLGKITHFRVKFSTHSTTLHTTISSFAFLFRVLLLEYVRCLILLNAIPQHVFLSSSPTPIHVN
jgi:hypothetical protein